MNVINVEMHSVFVEIIYYTNIILLIYWIGSQGSGMILVVDLNTVPFVNAVAHHRPVPL